MGMKLQLSFSEYQIWRCVWAEESFYTTSYFQKRVSLLYPKKERIVSLTWHSEGNKSCKRIVILLCSLSLIMPEKFRIIILAQLVGQPTIYS